MGNNDNLCFCNSPSEILDILMETTDKEKFEQGLIGIIKICDSMLAEQGKLKKRIEQLENSIKSEKKMQFDISTVSRMVGWKHPIVEYPTIKQIEDMEIKFADEPFYIAYRLLLYTRFLPKPINVKEKEVLQRIILLHDQYINVNQG
jgi:hypothetical protein